MAIGIGQTCSPAPANQSFAALTESVLRSVGMSGHTAIEPIAKDAINNAVRHLNTRNWSWMEDSENITLVADTAEYTLTTNLLKTPMAMELLNSSGNVNGRVGWQDPHEFMDMFPIRDTSGNPKSYTIFNYHKNCKVTFSSPVSSGFIATYPTARLRMYKRLAGYSSNGSTLVIPSEVELFIEYFARYEVALLARPSLAQETRAMWRNSEAAMMRSDADQISGDF